VKFRGVFELHRSQSPFFNGLVGGRVRFHFSLPRALRPSSANHLRSQAEHLLASSTRDSFPFPFEVVVDVVIQDSQHANPKRLDELLAIPVLNDRVADVVRLAIELNSQPQFGRIEIEPVRLDSELPPKLTSK
jgi:hypothetical protein